MLVQMIASGAKDKSGDAGSGAGSSEIRVGTKRGREVGSSLGALGSSGHASKRQRQAPPSARVDASQGDPSLPAKSSGRTDVGHGATFPRVNSTGRGTRSAPIQNASIQASPSPSGQTPPESVTQLQSRRSVSLSGQLATVSTPPPGSAANVRFSRAGSSAYTCSSGPACGENHSTCPTGTGASASVPSTLGR